MKNRKPTKGELYNFIKRIADGEIGEVAATVNQAAYDMLDIMWGKSTFSAVDSLLDAPSVAPELICTSYEGEHNPNPGRIVKGGGVCVECGGFISIVGR